MRSILTTALAAGSCLLVACGDGGGSNGSTADGGSRPDVVVTTDILGDIVRHTAGGAVDVEVIMPAGADPHEFAPSVRQAEAIERADLIVANGEALETGLLDAIDAAVDGGTPLFEITSAVELLERDRDDDEHDGEHDDEHDGEHDGEHDDDEAADDGHDRGAHDPHVWTDPSRMATAVRVLGARLAGLDGVDVAAVEAAADAYATDLDELDAEIAASLAPIPDDARVLVTSHEVFGYFADRYGFRIVGTVVPSLTTHAEASARELEELAATMEREGVSTIFADTSQPTALAEALADEVDGAVDVVVLHTESLGEPGSGADTYIGMMLTDAELILGALG